MKEVLLLTAVLAVLGASLLAGCVGGAECSQDSDCPTECLGKGGSPSMCSEGRCVVLEIYHSCMAECGASCESDDDCAADQSCYPEECECVEDVSGEPRLSFHAEECDLGIDPYSTETGVNKTTWVDGTTLEVRAMAILNCAESVEGGDYALSGNDLTLYYSYTPCSDVGLCALCMCANEMTYTFTNIQKKDYEISVEEREIITPCVTDEDCEPCTGPFSDFSECIGGKCIVTRAFGPECSEGCGAECESDVDCPVGYRCDRYYPEGSCQCVERERVATGGVSLSTDQAGYGLGRAVKITLRNSLSEGICYYAHGGSTCNKTPFNVSWFFGEEWQEFTTLQAGVLCSGDNEVFHCIDVPAGGEAELSWDQSRFDHLEDNWFKQSPPGDYKLTMKYRVGGAEEWEFVETDEFSLVY